MSFLFALDHIDESHGFRYVAIVSEYRERMKSNICIFSTGDLDNYVQNIHLLHPPSSNSVPSSRPKRIRKQKKFFVEESESISRTRKLKTPIRKKRPPVPQISSALQLTDAEIEQQFGERLPLIKSEVDDDAQQTVNSQVIIEFEPIAQVPQTPIEKARATLTTALGRKRGFLFEYRHKK